MGTPGNPLVGARGTLIRDAIRSRDYVAGSSGWSINADGTAEFNGVTIRGSGVFGDPNGERIELTDNGEIFIYNAANQLVASLDDFGLLVIDPSNNGFAQIALAAGVTILGLHPPDIAGHTLGSSLIYSDSDEAFGDAWMKLESPTIDADASSSIYLYGKNAGAETEIQLNATKVSAGGPNTIGRGPVARAFSAVDSAAVTAETVVLTASSFTYENERAYRATCGPLLSSSNANARVGMRLRKTNAAGQLLGYSGIMPMSPFTGNQVYGQSTFYFRNISGADITAFICLTVQNLDGGANTSQQRCLGTLKRWLLIEDCGDADSFDWAENLT